MSPRSLPAKAAPAPLRTLLPNPKARLKDQFHEVARFQHLAQRTEGAYWEWVVRFLKFHKARTGDWQHPRDLGSRGVTPFLTYLANERDVSASTQSQALNALIILYREVLGLKLGTAQGGQPHGRQNGNNRDDRKQLDQREPLRLVPETARLIVPGGGGTRMKKLELC